jgi:hypothetical protein
MKKRLFVLLLLSLLFQVPVFCQAPFPNRDEIEEFAVSRTAVVLEDDPFSAYNSYIREAMKQYWKITPHEFITVKEFNLKRSDPGYSFIVLTETNLEKDKTYSVYNFINLLQGKKVDKIGEMPEICAVPLSFAGEDDLGYGYKLGAILSFMQKHARLIMQDPSRTGRKYLKYYNENIPLIINKKILLKKEDLSPDIASEEQIRAICSYAIEIVTEEEIINAIEERAANTVILHKVGPVGERSDRGYCYKMLIGTDDAKMYYYNMHSIDKKNPNGFLLSDLKRLSRSE